MKIVHWASFLQDRPKAISGLFNSLSEILEAELELGVDAGICDTNREEGGTQLNLRRRDDVESRPWTWARDQESVNFISSASFPGFYDLPNKVALLHGEPRYCTLLEAYRKKDAMTTGWALLDACEMGVSWSKQEASYWESFGKPVEYVERGVDLQHWTPEGDRFNRAMRPQVSFFEVHRMVKMPTTFLFAVKRVHGRPGLGDMKVNMAGVNRSHAMFWKSLISKLELDLVFADLIIQLTPDPDKYYRESDLLVSPCVGGLMSRVAVEALACGCPVILLEGADEKHATLKCRDNPVDMADAIETVWNMVKENPEGMSSQARMLAEKHYDVRETAKSFIRIGERLA